LVKNHPKYLKMKNAFQSLFAIAIVAMSALTAPLYAQKDVADYKHPYLNASGQVLDSAGSKLGWITKEGIIHNTKGEKVAFIRGNEVVDAAGKKLGRIEKNVTYYNSEGAMVFTIEPNSKGERCKIFDPNGKVIAFVHESYKNQACAIHCLYKKMPMQ
jgi:hypothetical protein